MQDQLEFESQYTLNASLGGTGMLWTCSAAAAKGNETAQQHLSSACSVAATVDRRRDRPPSHVVTNALHGGHDPGTSGISHMKAVIHRWPAGAPERN